jgi:hypothetical protein
MLESAGWSCLLISSLWAIAAWWVSKGGKHVGSQETSDLMPAIVLWGCLATGLGIAAAVQGSVVCLLREFHQGMERQPTAALPSLVQPLVPTQMPPVPVPPVPSSPATPPGPASGSNLARLPTSVPSPAIAPKRRRRSRHHRKPSSPPQAPSLAEQSPPADTAVPSEVRTGRVMACCFDSEGTMITLGDDSVWLARSQQITIRRWPSVVLRCIKGRWRMSIEDWNQGIWVERLK